MWPAIILAAIVVFAVISYNGLVRLRERAEGAWSDVDVQLKRRYDLIPNLVETVKGYASHERETLEAVVSARSTAMGAQSPAAKAQAEGMLAGALKSLFALSESYPQLQAAGGFQDLQANLGQIEDQISQARRYYNAVVRDFNTKVHSVPSNVVAKTFGFKDREFFEMPEGERTVPKVDFTDRTGS